MGLLVVWSRTAGRAAAAPAESLLGNDLPFILRPSQRDGGSRMSSVTSGLHEAMISTSFAIEGFRVTRQLGIVRGITVRSRSIVGNIGAAFQTLFGGNISLYTALCERSRRDAFELMISHAAELGANAIVGMRYDATEVMQGVTEVLAYGTAVFVEPL